MSVLKLMLATIIASGLLMAAMPTTALADNNQNQNLEQTATNNCGNGNYNQNITCTITQNGDQTQTIIYRTGVKPATLQDTGLDTRTMSVVVALMAAGVIALVVKIKNRVA